MRMCGKKNIYMHALSSKWTLVLSARALQHLVHVLLNPLQVYSIYTQHSHCPLASTRSVPVTPHCPLRLCSMTSTSMYHPSPVKISTLSLLLILLAGTLVDSSTPCPAGTFTTPNKCEKCPPGTYQPNTSSTSCIPCPPGTFNIFKGAQGIDLCEPCKPNTFRRKPGATSPSACQRCPSGTASVAGASKCVTCPPGTFVALPSGAAERYQRGYNFCPPFTTGSRGSRENNPDCAFPRRTRCQKCRKATFSNSTNSRQCTRCPHLTFAVAGSTECRGCTRPGIQCVQGKRERECMSFKFNDGSMTECLDCPPGFIGNQRDGGSKCVPCPPGFFKDRRLNRCLKCEGEKVLIGRGTACLDAVPNTPCPSNYLRHKLGYCTRCERWERVNAKKRICQECPANRESEGGLDSKCRPCLPGMERPKGSETGCICKPGHVPMSKGKGCEKCPAGTARSFSTCYPCFPGTYSNTGAEECQPCPFNFVAPERGMAKCERCPRGFVPHPVRGCVSAATNCPAGQTRRLDENGFLVACVATSCPADKVLLSSACVSCTIRQRYDAARNGCVRCDSGSFSEGGASTTCKEAKCPEGYILNQEFGNCSCDVRRHVVNGKCELCSPGSAGTGCKPCRVGTFNNRVGQTRCIECNAGTFSDMEGATECKPCPSGKFTLWFGSANCVVRGSLA